MKLDSSLVEHGLTMEDVTKSDPPIENQNRVYFGNSYTVVKQCSQMEALNKSRVEATKAEALEQAMLAKHGENGWKQKEEEAKELNERKKADEEAKKKADKFKKDICDKWGILAEVACAGGIASSIEGLSLAKSIAKKEWYLRDQDLNGLIAEKVGRSVRYKITDLIRASEVRQTTGGGAGSARSSLNSTAAFMEFGCLRNKLEGRTERLRQYARYLQDRLDQLCVEHPNGLVQAAYSETRANMIARVREGEAILKKAQEDLRKQEHQVKMLDQFVPAASFLIAASATDKENAAAPRSKKRKTFGEALKLLSKPSPGVLA
jgi:hypothetical protein